MKKALTLLVVLTFLLLGCSDDSTNKYVQMVKAGHPNDLPNVTYGDAFSSFFASPSWRYFQSDDGKNVVEFTGKCTYHDVNVDALLQFVINKQDSTFEASYFNSPCKRQENVTIRHGCITMNCPPSSAMGNLARTINIGGMIA